MLFYANLNAVYGILFKIVFTLVLPTSILLEHTEKSTKLIRYNIFMLIRLESLAAGNFYKAKLE